MYIQNEKGSVVADCVSFFVSASKDKETQEIKHWAVVGTVPTGRNITVSQHDTEEAALAKLERISAVNDAIKIKDLG